MNNNQVTISSGITQFKKDSILKAMIHNHRLESKHRNIINDNTNYFYDMSNQEQKEILNYRDKVGQRATIKRQTKALYKKHFDNQMELMTERNKKKGYAKPKEKDLNPIAEGIVNFGNVYNVREDSEEVRLEKTKQFHEKYTEEQWREIFEQVKDNLIQFTNITNTELIDLTMHRDEEGLIHFHYLITNYNNQTGEHLNVRQNKNGIGDKLQDIIAKGFEEYEIGRAIGKKNGKKRLTKEELIELRSKNDEINQLKHELEVSKAKVKETKEMALEVILDTERELKIINNNSRELVKEGQRIFDIMKMIIEEFGDMDPNSKYNTKEKLNKIYNSAQLALGKDTQNFNILQSKMDKFEKIVKAYDKKGGGDGSSTEKLEEAKRNLLKR